MNFNSKETQLLFLGILSLVLSKTIFFFFNDPEGPNLLVVAGMALALYFPSISPYLLSSSATKKFALALFIQIFLSIVFYFSL